MSLDDALYTRLSTDSTITALVGVRIYPLKAPDDVQPPLIAFSRIHNASEEALAHGSGIAQANYQIDCWATQIGTVDQIVERLRLRLQGFRGTVSGVNVQGIIEWTDSRTWEQESQLFRGICDCRVWYGEAIAYDFT